MSDRGIESALISPAARATLKGQQPLLLWLTGISGAGKTTIARRLEAELHRAGRHTYLLDGDDLRRGLCADLGFTEADRRENIRRAGALARAMCDAGLIVIAAFISPFRAEREMVRAMFRPGEFVEIFVNTPLEMAERRDVKGLYRRARAGEIANFTGIDSPYEAPDSPDIYIETLKLSAEDAARLILAHIEPGPPLIAAPPVRQA